MIRIWIKTKSRYLTQHIITKQFLMTSVTETSFQFSGLVQVFQVTGQSDSAEISINVLRRTSHDVNLEAKVLHHVSVALSLLCSDNAAHRYHAA